MRPIILAAAVALAMPASAGSREDDAIRLNVETNLRQVQVLAGDRLDVYVTDGIVRLSGTVATLYRKWHALDQTSRVRGVLSIQDAIELEGGSRSTTGLLVTIERRLEDIPRDAIQKLEISVNDGTVTLKRGATLSAGKLGCCGRGACPGHHLSGVQPRRSRQDAAPTKKNCNAVRLP